MQPRGKVAPPLPELRQEIDRRLAEGVFAGYDALAGWLGEQGYTIARQRAARPGQRFEQRLDEIRAITEQARAVVESVPDEEGGINEALLRLVQQRLFEILLALDAKDIKQINLSALARSVAELGRAAVVQRRWLAELRAKVAQKVNAAGAKVTAAARSAGLSPETEERIRNALLEITV